MAAFAARLKDAVDLDTIREELADVVQTTLEPAGVRVWTARPSPLPGRPDDVWSGQRRANPVMREGPGR